MFELVGFCFTVTDLPRRKNKLSETCFFADHTGNPVYIYHIDAKPIDHIIFFNLN